MQQPETQQATSNVVMGNDLKQQKKERGTSRAARQLTASMTATLLILLTGVGCQQPIPPAPARVWEQYEALQAVKLIRLPDRSKTWLNTRSSIRYDSAFSNGKRESWMQGEAYFEVDTAGGVPFEVHAGPVTARATGASFNIEAYDTANSITVTVKKGKVVVLDAARELAQLLPGQRITWQVDGSFKQDSTSADAQMAWASDQSVFNNMKFGEVAKRLERKYGIEMIFRDPSIRDCSITASFDHTASLNTILDKIAQLNGSEIVRGENLHQYYISGKKKCK